MAGAVAEPPARPRTGHEALAAWLEHLANERRASPRTVEAYQACVLAYLAFLTQHRGGAPSVADLGEISAADIRAYLASRRTGDRPLSPRSLSQALSAIRAFHRFLDRRLGTPNAALSLVRGPRVKPGVPRPVSEDQAMGMIEEAAEDLAVVETSQRRRNGNQLPSWDVWSRPERFRTWNKSTYTLYPSRSTKLSTGFYQS